VKIRFLILVFASVIGIALTAIFYIHPPIHFRQPLLLGVYIILHFWLVWRHRNLKFTPARMLVSCLLAFAWLYSSHTQALSKMPLSQWVIFIVTGLCISLSFYLLTEELQKPFSKPTKKVTPWWMLLYGLIPIIGWLPYFLAYYPGKMNADSFWQWAMAHRVTEYNDWHPILHTWMIQATTLVYDSPVSYTVFQMVVLSFSIAYSLYILHKMGMPIWLVLVIDLFYALNPVNGFLSITMWKDIPFAAAILFLTVFFAQIVNNSHWLKKRSNACYFVIVCFFAMNLRHNGIEVVVASLIILVLLAKEMRRRLLLLMIPIILLQVIFSGPIMHYFRVTKGQLNEALAIPSQQIAATYKHHGKFTPQLKTYFDQILPAQNWSKDYIPYTVNPVKWDHKYNQDVIYADFPKYLTNWADLLSLNPKLFIRSYLDHTAVIWQFSTPKGEIPYLDTQVDLQDYPSYRYIRVSQENWHTSFETMKKVTYSKYVRTLKQSFPGRKVPTFAQYQARVSKTIAHLKTQPKSEKLRKTMDKVFKHTRLNWKNYLVKGAIPFFLLLLGLMASISRFRIRGLAVFLPALFVILTLGIAIPATDFRYLYGFVLSVPFLLFYPKLTNRNLESDS
jgi:hypothetical protein